jgi:hypothetical protein
MMLLKNVNNSKDASEYQTEDQSITYVGCTFQAFFFLLSVGIENHLLAIIIIS